MKLFDVFPSEKGYRVAGKIVNGSPVIDRSPWFSTKAEAVAHANARMEDHPAFRKVNGEYVCAVDFFVSE